MHIQFASPQIKFKCECNLNSVLVSSLKGFSRFTYVITGMGGMNCYQLLFFSLFKIHQSVLKLTRIIKRTYVATCTSAKAGCHLHVQWNLTNLES